MPQLTDFHVAVLATDGFEVNELTEPIDALKAAGGQVSILSLKAGKSSAFVMTLIRRWKSRWIT